MEVSDLDAILRLLVALVLGALVGVEREYSRHSAGLRTMAAVSMGACLFTVLGLLVVRAEPTRIAAQVVTGIGFLGGGAILRSGVSVRGLTTAAAIWVVAAIGMTVGFGRFLVAGAATVLVLAFLLLLKPVEERAFRSRFRDVEPQSSAPGEAE